MLGLGLSIPERSALGTGGGSPPPVPPVGTSAAARHQASAADNVSTTVSIDFNPSDVDIAGQRLLISGHGFAPASYPTTLGPACPCYIGPAGSPVGWVPPGGTAADTPYYAAEVGGATYLYPVAQKGVGPLPSGQVAGEDVPPAQYFAQAENRIVFTSQGTGTHRLYTKELVSEVADQTGNGIKAGSGSTNKHTFLERLTDPDGKKFLRIPGITMQDNLLTANYSENGIFWVSKESAPDRAAYVAKMAGARFAWCIAVARVRYDENFTVIHFKPTSVDTSGDTITFAAHGITTGDPVYFKPLGGTIPSPFVSEETVYARAVSANVLSFYPSAADAVADTNKIDITTTGSGDYQLVCPVRTSDYRREGFFAEARGPDSGADCCSLQTDPNAPNFNGIRTLADWTTSGSGNGEINNMGGFPDLTEIRLRVPPAAILPPPAAGHPQVAGETSYWITHKPGSNTLVRLSLSLADAQAALGVATSASNCLKYSGPGLGSVLWNYADDGFMPFSFGQNKSTVRATVANPPRMPIKVRKAYTALIDYNDPGQSGPALYVGCNVIGATPNILAGTKGNLSSTQNTAIAAMTRFNSGQPHVPLFADEFDFVIGFSTTDPRDDMQLWLDYLTAEYALT